MTVLDAYFLLSPFAVLAVAGAATWLLVGRENAPLGARANAAHARAGRGL